MSSIGILLTSRNNYDFMEKFWIPKTIGFCEINCKVLNIDEDSSLSEKAKGKKICEKHGIDYMDREESGMHHNIDTAIRFFGDSVKYIIWFQHDCWPLQKDFFNIFEELVSDGKLDDFGTIGFNAIAKNIFKRGTVHEETIEKFNRGEKPICVLSRCHLESVGGMDLYCCGIRGGRIKRPCDPKLFSKPCAISVPAWYAIAVNTSLYKKTIDIDRKFYFFKSWDDISYQFLNNNIYNIVLPELYIEHRPDFKKILGLPNLSVKGVKKDDTYHSAVGSDMKEWIKIWGWDMAKPSTFENVKRRYRKKLKRQFYKYDYVNKGPLKVFDIM